MVVVALLLAVGGAYAATQRHTTGTPSVSVSSTVAPVGSAPSATTPASGGNGTGSSGAPPGVPTALSVGVVDVDTRLGYQGGAAAGTGMLVTATGEVLTNNHVIDGATDVSVTVVSTGKSYRATVVGTDPTADVAVLKLANASGLPVVHLGDSSTLHVGDAVTAVGNAGGVGGAPTLASGAVTDLDQEITASDPNGSNAEQLTGLIEMNAALRPGESGGPLYNASGEVVGMNTAGTATRRRAPSTDSFAIPINSAMAVVKQIDSGTSSDAITIGTPGFLGVEIDGSAPASSSSGVAVSSVVAGTPAAKIGLEAGDVITAIDSTKIDGSAALSQALHTHHGGDSVNVTWTGTDGRSHTASAVLVAGPAN